MSQAERSMTVGEQALSAALRCLPVRHGKHRLLDHVRPRPWVRDTRLVRMRVAGASLLMDPGDLVGWHFVMLKSFDPEVSEILVAAAAGTTAPVFWDIGANKGACSYAIATRLPEARIVAVEPQIALAELTRTNLAGLAPGRFEVFPVGIGTTEGAFELAIPGANRGAASLVFDKVSNTDPTTMIAIETATQVRDRSSFGWPTIIKLDVEGFEPAVVESLAPCFAARHCQAMVFENHAEQVESFATIRSIVTPHGYQFFAIRKNAFGTKLAPTDRTISGVFDYVIVRDDVANRPRLARLRIG